MIAQVRMGNWAPVVWCVASVMLAVTGCGGDAELSCSLRPDLQVPGNAQADCDVTFLRALKSGDATHVRLALDGQTLLEPVSFEYDFLAPLDKTAGGPLDPTQSPPLNHRLRWRVPIHLVPSLRPEIGDFIVHVTLYWGDKKQDMARMNTKSVYSPN